jgi:ABC-type multidrug transport system fused ATPase/permease subunit
LSIYKKFAAIVHTHLSTPIRVFRADSTGEYISRSLRDFLAGEGTLAQFSCPSARAQNGVVERKHCHLLEMAHALMIVASLPPHFWYEAISTATYLVNIQPSAAVVFLSSVSLDVLLITWRFVYLVAFAIFFLPLVNAPN